MTQSINTLAQQVIEQCKLKSVMIATAESCTGGLIAAALTDIAGSSAVVDRGFITYSNEAKMTMLDVSEALLAEHGAVSALVAQAMAEGAILASNAKLSIAVTGIAGPSGGTEEKPVGLVFVAVSINGSSHVQQFLFAGNRKAVREQTVVAALNLILAMLS